MASDGETLADDRVAFAPGREERESVAAADVDDEDLAGRSAAKSSDPLRGRVERGDGFLEEARREPCGVGRLQVSSRATRRRTRGR